MSGFERLHQSLQHHIVSSLGWSSLRPLQEAAIGPILDGEHSLILAPTAGGKTEAAVFPLLTRVLSDHWKPTSILYVCPLKALLNNLDARLRQLGALVGCRAERWHGDVSDSDRRRIVSDPPDILLTTPESLEAMLVTGRVDRRGLFERLRTVVVDEIHAFAGDDRGWHLLAVLERVSRFAGRPLQRIGLSATVGNPDDLLTWLVGSSAGPRRVVSVDGAGIPEPEIGLDYVASLENAAIVVSQLHRREKRLVFCDSRSRVEDLAVELRKAGTETYLSHSSLSREARDQAEQAFASGTSCVIAATSSLELGIDVGDLDRVIQIGAPATVASFLQRMGRTGRRPGTTRNCLFLATEVEELLLAAALARVRATGWIEPVRPPPEPFHVLAQQLFGLILQHRALGKGLGVGRWRDWLGDLPVFRDMAPEQIEKMLRHMLATELLHEDSGVLGLGPEGDRRFAGKAFMDVLSVFTTAPLFGVYHGERELGSLDPISFSVKGTDDPIILLGGKAWRVVEVDWKRMRARVEPTALDGKSRWKSEGLPLSFRVCRAMREVLAGEPVPATLSRRATDRLALLREEFAWVDGESTVVLRDGGTVRWFTFAGRRANNTLVELFSELRDDSCTVSNLELQLRSDVSDEDFGRVMAHARTLPDFPVPVNEAAIEGLKFSECLPRSVGEHELAARLRDDVAVKACLAERVRWVTVEGADGPARGWRA